MKLFHQFPKAKGGIYIISNLEYTLLIFSLLTVYHLLIQHNIFKDCIDRNVLNSGYGCESTYILVVGRASPIAAGEVCFRRLKRWKKLWSRLTRTRNENLNHLKIQTGMTFCFVYVKISLFFQYRTIVFDYEMILFTFYHSGGMGSSPHLTIFFEPPPPTKTNAPPWTPPTLKNEGPHLKNKPLIET